MCGWIAVVSAEHARRGVAGGFLQVCHGKAGPLRRMAPGDRVAIYSPGERMGGPAALQAFTAFGAVRRGEPCSFDTGGGFVPWRREVDWHAVRLAPIAPLLPVLSFSAGRRNWGAALRLGLLGVPGDDMDAIAAAMAPG